MQQTSTCTGYITTEWADIKERVQILYVQPCAELFNLLIGGGDAERRRIYVRLLDWQIAQSFTDSVACDGHVAHAEQNKQTTDL